MSDLLPCPFCGSEAEYNRWGDRNQSEIVQCTNCSCSLEYNGNGLRESDWNKRANNGAKDE